MKIKMLVKRIEYISVEVSEECGYDVPLDTDTLSNKFNFIESIKGDYEQLSTKDNVARAEAQVVYTLESFVVVEEC